MDKELFKKLIAIQSTESDDREINEFITSEISKIKGVSVSKDTFGNIYATKGIGKDGYKCIVSHTDTVHKMYKQRQVHEVDNIVFCTTKMLDPKYKSEVIVQVGTGGDDKNGIYTCIKALQEFDDIKATFFRFEESGCRGSNASNIEFFKDCNFVVQCDRRGNSDFITNVSGTETASKEFVETMRPLFGKYGYKDTYGLSTDVGTLKRRGLPVSAFNMSCGYYDPHTHEETCNLVDLQACYDLVTEMFNKHGKTRFEHKYETTVYTSYRPSTYTPREKAPFSFNLFNNFFANDKDVTIVNRDNNFSFIQIPGTKKYKLVFDEYMFYDNIACPICGDKDEMAFYTDIAMFFCLEKSHNEFICVDEMYVNAILEENSINYVYDRIYDVWYKDTDAKYNTEINSYELK